MNYNNAEINKSYGRLEDFMWLFKFPWSRGRVSLKFIDNLGTQPQKGSPTEAVVSTLWFRLGYRAVQYMVIHVFKEQSGSVFPHCQKMEAVCSDRNLGSTAW
jgi:hypothetical protein